MQVQGKGAPARNKDGVPGNLMVEFQVERHPVFTRSNWDILMSKNVDLVDALLGTVIRWVTLLPLLPFWECSSRERNGGESERPFPSGHVCGSLPAGRLHGMQTLHACPQKLRRAESAVALGHCLIGLQGLRRIANVFATCKMQQGVRTILPERWQ